MDYIDKADDSFAKELDASVSKIRANLNTGPSSIRCEDCGRIIPKKRRKAVPGCTRCIGCQAAFEKLSFQ
jgi:phage/conjugal plasmid C-4 type zinc finger TraR family protein